MVWINGFISVILVSLVSFVGVLTFSFKADKLRSVLISLVAFSAGALIGDAFIHLLPEAAKNGFTVSVSISIFSGIIFFFILEKILRWRHCHEVNCSDHPKHLGMMNLFGDGLHNFIDGALIGVSFLTSTPIGIATTVAVVLHEIPQELGDFGVLLHSGFTRKRAVLFNFLSATIAILGLVFALSFGEKSVGFSSFMIPFAAGGFIYIALSDLVPELHKEEEWQSAVSHIIFISLGILIMFSLLFLEK